MPVPFVAAFAVSVCLHAFALFATDLALFSEAETNALEVRLVPLPPVRSVEGKTDAKRVTDRPPEALKGLSPRTRQNLSARDARGFAEQSAGPPEPMTAAENPAPAADTELSDAPESSPRLPPQGMIRYRVDRGDSNFEIGFAQHTWEIRGNSYRLLSAAETTGLVWIFKPVRVQMESRGQMNHEGFQPEHFAIDRNGIKTRDNALFDWASMKITVGGRSEHKLTTGAQDLLSFAYQLGFLPHLESGVAITITTGRKYGTYRLEVVGEETVELPFGVVRTLHLRVPGVSTTELWLAIDSLLLPVKIRYVDAAGDAYVQVATQVLLADDEGRPLDLSGAPDEAPDGGVAGLSMPPGQE